MDLVRLACVKHAASVHPEPGSNSPTKACPSRAAAEAVDLLEDEVSASAPPRSGIPPRRSVWLCGRPLPMGGSTGIRVAAGRVADSRIDRQLFAPPGGGARTARTGVLSSLPFSRSRSSGTRSELGLRGRLGVGAGPFRRGGPSVRRS
jgi:hypothetical protein